MSKKLLSFLLSELKTVRVICKRLLPGDKPCGGIVEVTIERLGKMTKCPLCNGDLVVNGGSQRLFNFAHVVRELLDDSPLFQLEFVIPDDK